MAGSFQVVCPSCKSAHRLETAVQPGTRFQGDSCGHVVVIGEAAPAEPKGDHEATLAFSQDSACTDAGADVRAPGAAPSAEGRAAGRYVERGVIGQGAMGQILSCVDRDTRREVAMKRMLPETAANPARRARFVEEAQVTAQLEHPNIVPVHELGRDSDGNVYYTMKRVRGRALSEILQALREGTETHALSALLQIFLKACDAVGFAHSRGVLHRDLKPSNIMVGDFGEVLVMDWGLAKVMGRTAGPADTPVSSDRADSGLSATRDSAVVGTPAYMSPEQAAGRIDQVDPRSDIYSLGAILYELLTLAPPVSASTEAEALEAVRRGRVVPPERRAPGRRVPRELSEITMKCLARSREDRYQSVPKLREDVARFLEGREVWLPVCSFDFREGPLDPRFEVLAVHGPLWEKPRFSDGTGRVTVGRGRLRVQGAPGSFALRWRQEVGEETRVAVTLVNRGGVLLVSVSGDCASGYRLAFHPGVGRMWLETAVRGTVETLQEGCVPVDRSRPSWDIVLERAGQWVRAAVDGARAIEYYDPLPLWGAGHRTFSLVLSGNAAITGLKVWRRRPAETASVLQAGRALLRNGHYAEAADFFAQQVSMPRGTTFDDEALFLLGLSQEGMGARDDAVASYRRLARAPNRSMAAMARLELARICLVAGKLGEAGREARQALALDPAAPAADLLRRTMVDLIRNPGAVSVSSADKEGLAALAEAMGGKLLGSLAGGRSLEPIRDIPLTEVECCDSEITDLSPLRGMPLKTLNLRCCRRITDLGPLRGMALEWLSLWGCPGISDLTPLRGMPLRYLGCGGTGVTDLRCLAGMPLTELMIDEAALCDLSPLEGMPLEVLYCMGTSVSDIRPLKGMPLRHLWLSGTAVHDLGPLEGMRLRELGCGRTGVRDLAPLRGMLLEVLSCGSTQVADLSPLAGMPLKQLDIDDCPGVTDFTPLAGMELQRLAITPSRITKGMDVIRGMTSLELICPCPPRTKGKWMDAEEFWRRYDAGEFR